MNAFPIAIPAGCEGFEDGMTLRDYFAGQAVMGLIACSTVKTLDGQLLAESSYNVADAMIEARGE